MTMKKNNEELKERLMKIRALSDEDLEKISGGVITEGSCGRCPNCQSLLIGIFDTSTQIIMNMSCIDCGYTNGGVNRFEWLATHPYP